MSWHHAARVRERERELLYSFCHSLQDRKHPLHRYRSTQINIKSHRRNIEPPLYTLRCLLHIPLKHSHTIKVMCSHGLSSCPLSHVSSLCEGWQALPAQYSSVRAPFHPWDSAKPTWVMALSTLCCLKSI